MYIIRGILVEIGDNDEDHPEAVFDCGHRVTLSGITRDDVRVLAPNLNKVVQVEPHADGVKVHEPTLP